MSYLDEGSIKADYINTQDQLADLLTKVPWAGQVPGASRQDWDGSNSPEGATQGLGGE